MQKLHKIYATIIMAVLVLSIMTPIHTAYASTGHPELGAVDDRESPTTLTVASSNVSIPAGSDEIEKIDGVSSTGYFAIIFYDTDWLVTFSGAQFDLYISRDGYSRISAGDKRYAAGFLVSDLDAVYPKTVHIHNALLKGGEADFYIGTFGSYKIIVGPIPFDITADYKFIKIFDGDSTAVAVSAQIVEVLPSIELTPTEGPGGRQVTLVGTALLPNAFLNLTYGSSNANDEVFAQTSTNGDGKFSYTWNIKDLKEEFGGSDTPIPQDAVNVYVWYNATGNLVDSVTYYEYRRAFLQVKGVTEVSTSLPNGYGNDTITVDVNIFGDLIVSGVYFNPTSSVSFTVGTVSLGMVTPNATGFFNITLTVPELTMGTHTVKVLNAGVLYVFTIIVLPTLVLIPEEGPVGTVVTAEAYGFPESSAVYIYWFEVAKGDGKYYWMANATTGADGKFNVTVQFIVPHAYGGMHPVDASDTYQGKTTSLFIGYIAGATFTITPTLVVEPSEFNNDGSLIKAVGTGLDPDTAYTANIDNQYFGATNDGWYTTALWANATGDMEIYFVAAGFRPGLHVFSLYPWAEEPPYTPAAYALFTVTTEGDLVVGFLRSMNATLVEIRDGMAIIQAGQEELQVSLSAINASLVDLIIDAKGEVLVAIDTALGTVTTKLDDLDAKIVAINGTVATISTAVGDIQASLSDLDAKIVSIDGTVATINTNVGEVKTSLSSIDAKLVSLDDDVATISTVVGDVNASISDIITAIESVGNDAVEIKTTLGTISGKVTSIDGTVATIKTDVGTVKADISTIKGYFPITVDMTPVWAAVVLSLIAAIAAIYAVITIRRKIAG
jgi:methyl-accepting chemotaxis protein